MAFNPFDVVRKRSKAVFAVLGIVVMLTFVLSAGAGMGQGLDFFDQIGSLFGGRDDGETLAEAYGDKISARDLQEIRQQRTAANEFMLQVIDMGDVRTAEEISGDITAKRFAEDTREGINRLVSLKVASRKGSREANEYLQYAARLLSGQTQESQKLRVVLERSTLPTEDRDALRTILQIAQRDLGRTRRDLFFRTLGIETDKELLEFALMLKKADQLGIRYSPMAVEQLIESETKSKFSVKKDWNSIENKLRDRNKELTTAWLIDAIANEYRVRAVLTTMMGNAPAPDMPGIPLTTSDVPGALTPYSFYEYYKDRCSEFSFSLLEIPAEAFLSKVTTEPTAKEREDLFKKYAGDEPDPAREKPGFREPRKVKIEFITVDAKDKRISENIANLQMGKTILSGFAAASAVGGNHISAITPLAYTQRADEVAMRSEILDKVQSANRPYAPGEWYQFVPRDNAIYQPVPIVSLMAGLSGMPNPVVASSAYGFLFRQVELADHKVRIPLLIQGVLAPFSTSAAGLLGSPAFSIAHTPKAPPEGLYTKDVADNFKKTQIRDTFEMDIRQFQSKLAELTREASPFLGKPDKAKSDKAKAEAKKYVEQWVKDRNVKLNGNKEPRDKWALTSDPDLKVLNDLAISDPEGTNSFSKKYYEMNDFRQFGLGMVLSVSPYRPEWFPAEPSGDGLDKPNHLAWLADDTQPQSYNNLTNANKLTNNEMTKRVDAAWKLQKARDLAKAEADELAKKMKEIAKTVSTDPLGVDKQLRDLAFANKARKIDIDRLAKLKFAHGTNPREMDYQPPTIEKYQVTYPTGDFAEQLLELRNKPMGEVIVLNDAPRSRYYVAALVAKREKSPTDFRDEVFLKSSVANEQMVRNPLFGTHALREERGKAVMEALERIKAEAKYTETEAFKKREKTPAEAQ